MIHYVCGFAFNLKRTQVALILKNKGPAEIIGKWNGIGGKVERNEGMLEAMQREFQEEAGVWIPDWELICGYWSEVGDYRVNFYVAYADLSDVQTMESEEVSIWDLSLLNSKWLKTPHNVTWLIPIALDPHIKKPITIHEL